MMAYTVRGATSSDIEAIMHVEQQSFADGIAETQVTFAERLTCADQCNYVLLSSDSQSVCGYVTAEIWDAAQFDPALFSLGHSVREQHRPDGTALYISSFALLPEVRGTRIPRTDIPSALLCAAAESDVISTQLSCMRSTQAAQPASGQYQIGTDGDTADTGGNQRTVPAKDQNHTVGLAALFFSAALECIIASFPQLDRIVLLVHEDWRKAIALYEAYGFTRMHTLEQFAWFGGKRAFIYEKALDTQSHRGPNG